MPRGRSKIKASRQIVEQVQLAYPAPTEAAMTYDFLTNTGTGGATLAMFGASEDNLDAGGLTGGVGGTGVTFTSAWSMDPSHWPDTAPGWAAPTFVDAGIDVDGFNVYNFTPGNSTYSGKGPALTRTYTTGDVICIRARCSRMVGEDQDVTGRLFALIGGNPTEIANSTSIAPNAAPATWTPQLGSVEVLDTDSNAAAGWHEVSLRWTLPAAIGVVTAIVFTSYPDNESAAIWGLQVNDGPDPQEWFATDADGGTLSAGTTLTFSGAVEDLFLTGTYTVVMELGPVEIGATSPAELFIDSDDQPFLSQAGHGRITGPGGGSDCVLGTGGWGGPSIVAMAMDDVGHTLAANGGKSTTVGATVMGAGPFRLLAGNPQRLRKIKLWNTRLSENALVDETFPYGKTFDGMDRADYQVVPTGANSTFVDEFKQNSLLLRAAGQDLNLSPFDNGVYPNSVVASYPPAVGKYWIPRYRNHETGATGQGTSLVNNEHQEFRDPQFPLGPVQHSFGDDAGADGVCILEARLSSTLTVEQQATIPDRVTDAAVNTGPFAYVSACMTSLFSQKFGIFEARMKMPAGAGLTRFWPAFWLMADTGGWKVELDIVEQIGDGVVGKDTVHSHYTTDEGTHLTPDVNPGAEVTQLYDPSEDYHTYALIWSPGRHTYYRDGAVFWDHVYDPNDSDADDYAMYMLFDFAIGGSWPGAPTADTDAALPAQLMIDYCKVYQI